MQRSVSWYCRITCGLQNVLRVNLRHENLRHVIHHQNYVIRHCYVIHHRSYVNRCYVSCLQSCVSHYYVNCYQNYVFLHYGCVLRY